MVFVVWVVLVVVLVLIAFRVGVALVIQFVGWLLGSCFVGAI